MTIEKLRGVGKTGIIADLDPYDLPLDAFSAGVNIRFRNAKVASGPVFRSVLHLGTSDPRFLVEAAQTQGTTELFIGYMNGTVKLYSNGTETDFTASGYTPVPLESPWTSTFLDGIVYINRADRPPWYLTPTATQFVDLSTQGASPNRWEPTWNTKILRQCANALVALNVTKGALSFPNLVKTSSPVVNIQIPASWDQTTAATLATENTLGAMDGPITDACPLGSDLIIYGRREAWRMHADGSQFVYDYTKLPFKKGSINTNCSQELDGKNYVFGMDDLWVHDGVSEQSLCDQKVRDYIFGSMNVAQSFKNFVTYNPRLNEILFCYVSGDALVNFLMGVDGCNRAAVYNITNGTWSFDDLPSIWYAADAPLPNFQTYANTTATYDTVGGSYQDQEDGDKRVCAMVGSSNTAHNLSTSLYAFDEFGTNSVAAFSVDPNATGPRILERVGIDLHELDAELRGYKTVSTMWPQARVDTSGGNALMISVGASDNIGDLAPTYGPAQPYDGKANYKVDVNAAGRWLAIRLRWNDFREMTLTGFDLDIKNTGRR